MEGNPYAQLAGTLGNMMKESTRPFFRFGVVRGVSPLCVQIAGLEYSGAELLKNSIFDCGDMKLSSGDSVLCLALDEEDMRFLVLARVVEA